MAVQGSAGPPATVQPEPGTQQLQTSIGNLLSNHADEEESASRSTNGSPTIDSPNATSHFHELPDELLDHILGYLVHDSAKLLPFDRRASLSFESFASAPPHVPEDTNNLNTFVRQIYFSNTSIGCP
jgi:hypothetical protein